jgi:hypothetical protein
VIEEENEVKRLIMVVAAEVEGDSAAFTVENLPLGTAIILR